MYSLPEPEDGRRGAHAGVRGAARLPAGSATPAWSSPRDANSARANSRSPPAKCWPPNSTAASRNTCTATTCSSRRAAATATATTTAWGEIATCRASCNGHFFLDRAQLGRQPQHAVRHRFGQRQPQAAGRPAASRTSHFVMQQQRHAALRRRHRRGQLRDDVPLQRRQRQLGQARRKPGTRYAPRAFSADDSEFVVIHSADGGRTTLIKENLATGARTTLFADPRGSVERAACTAPRAACRSAPPHRRHPERALFRHRQRRRQAAQGAQRPVSRQLRELHQLHRRRQQLLFASAATATPVRITCSTGPPTRPNCCLRP